MQLRVCSAVRQLASKFNTDVSLFRRMIHKETDFMNLTTQHRMRREIASLINSFNYSLVESHESVLAHERVRGVEKSLFFIDHNQLEEFVSDGIH